MLSSTILSNELRTFSDNEYPLFSGFPLTFEESAERWSQAMYIYASTMVPVPIPGSLLLAKEAFKSVFLTMKGINNESNWVILANAFGAFASVVSVNVYPYIPSYTPLGVVLYPLLKPVSLQGLGGASSFVCIEYISSVVDAWYKTGVSMTTTTPPTFITWI